MFPRHTQRQHGQRHYQRHQVQPIRIQGRYTTTHLHLTSGGIHTMSTTTAILIQNMSKRIQNTSTRIQPISRPNIPIKSKMIQTLSKMTQTLAKIDQTMSKLIETMSNPTASLNTTVHAQMHHSYINGTQCIWKQWTTSTTLSSYTINSRI